jgi:hypothetical protein
MGALKQRHTVLPLLLEASNLLPYRPHPDFRLGRVGMSGRLFSIAAQGAHRIPAGGFMLPDYLRKPSYIGPVAEAINQVCYSLPSNMLSPSYLLLSNVSSHPHVERLVRTLEVTAAR